MTQSAILVASLVGLFVLYLAAKGRLSAYGAVLFGPAGGTAKKSSGILGTGISTSDVINVAKTAAELAA